MILSIRRPVARLLITTAVLLAVGAGDAQASPEPLDQTTHRLTTGILAQVSQAATSRFPAVGQYLFGQVPQPEQPGQGYIVLESTATQVYGALYFPNSSFDCFTGQVQGEELALTITNSYTQEVYPYNIALSSDTRVASVGATGSTAPISLSGFYQLDALTDNDLRILEVCRGAVTSDL